MHTANKDADKSDVSVGRLTTLANIISFSRIFIAAPIIYSYIYFDGVNWVFTSLVAYGILSDYLDGWAARGKNDITELGKVLDPLADKIMAGALFIFAAWLGLIPLWFLLLAIGRDLIILAGSVYISKKHGKVAMSIWSGKVFVNVLAIYWLIVMYLPENQFLADFFSGAATMMLIYSFGDYVFKFIEIQRGKNFN